MYICINIYFMEYHKDTTHISKSGLDLIRKCPAKYYAKYMDSNAPKQKTSDALLFGDAYHTMILEPIKFKNDFVVMPPMRGEGSVKMKQQFIENNAGKKIITAETFSKIRSMRDVLMDHPIAGSMIRSEGLIEKRFNWECRKTGVKCKIKPDKLLTKKNYAIDLKTTEDASDDGFGRSARKFRYHVQGAFYTDGLIQNGFQIKAFIFIAQEKEYPYLINVQFLNNEGVEMGREEYIEDLETYASCIKSNTWPGYGDEITELKLF